MQRARDDVRMVRLREDMLHAIQGAVELWSTDAGISEVRLGIFGSHLRASDSKKDMVGPQRPLQIDHGALGRCYVTLVAAGTTA